MFVRVSFRRLCDNIRSQKLSEKSSLDPIDLR